MRRLSLWLLAAPLLCTALGIGLNQAVLVANHDQFPVMMNPYATLKEAELVLKNKDLIAVDVIGGQQLIDEVHCVMTPQTHLNWLADWIDIKTAWISPGDCLIWVGGWLWGFMPFCWMGVMYERLLK